MIIVGSGHLHEFIKREQETEFLPCPACGLTWIQEATMKTYKLKKEWASAQNLEAALQTKLDEIMTMALRQGNAGPRWSRLAMHLAEMFEEVTVPASDTELAGSNPGVVHDGTKARGRRARASHVQ